MDVISRAVFWRRMKRKSALARASEELCISKLWGDSSRYDFIVEHAGKLLRVQVKCMRRWRSYVCRLPGQLYTSTQIDFLVA